MLEWDIQIVTYSVNTDGTSNKATGCRWTVTKYADALAASEFGKTIFQPGHPATEVPYADITEAQMIGWVQQVTELVSLEQRLDAQLTAVAQVTEAEGKPWETALPQWVVNVAYEVDDVVERGSMSYQCIQAHTSNTTWPPEHTPALWNHYTPSEEGGPAPWVQPTGAHDAYTTGDRVTHNSATWLCDAANNVWEPGVYGWTVEHPPT